MPGRHRRRVRIGVRLGTLTVIAAIVSAGCTGSGSGGDKAGGSGAPVVLKLAEGGASPETDLAVADFARRVDRISQGKLRIDLVSGWGGEVPEAEQQTVRDVA